MKKLDDTPPQDFTNAHSYRPVKLSTTTKALTNNQALILHHLMKKKSSVYKMFTGDVGLYTGLNQSGIRKATLQMVDSGLLTALEDEKSTRKVKLLAVTKTGKAALSIYADDPFNGVPRTIADTYCLQFIKSNFVREALASELEIATKSATSKHLKEWLIYVTAKSKDMQ